MKEKTIETLLVKLVRMCGLGEILQVQDGFIGWQLSKSIKEGDFQNR